MKKIEDGYDFVAIEQEADDDTSDMWEYYQKLCFAQIPPVPVMTPMKALCDKDTYSANFRHYRMGKNVGIVLNVLLKLQGISELDLMDNGLESECAESIVEFVKQTQSLSTLNLAQNPHIRTKSMTQILEAMASSAQGIESLNISNTGCMNMGKQLAQIISSCFILQNLYCANCGLGMTAIDFAKAIPNSQKLRILDLSMNGLHAGGKRLAVALGQSIAKSAALKSINLSKNALTAEQVMSLMRSMADCATLKTVDLHDNSIGDEAGRAISNFFAKSGSIKHFDISSNPILNVTINIVNLKKKLAEEKDKPGNKKDKKPKEPVPGAYVILNGVAKSTTLKDIKMIGLVVKQEEWDAKVEACKAANPNCEILYTSAMSARYDFGVTEPPPKVEEEEDPKAKGKTKK